MKYEAFWLAAVRNVYRQIKSTYIGDTFSKNKTVSHTGCLETSQLGNSTVIHHLQKKEEAQKNPPLELRAKGKRRPLTASHVSIKIRLERNVLINKWTNEGACRLGWSARHEWDVNESFGKDLLWCKWFINRMKILELLSPTVVRNATSRGICHGGPLLYLRQSLFELQNSLRDWCQSCIQEESETGDLFWLNCGLLVSRRRYHRMAYSISFFVCNFFLK